jgi:dolichyl-diphosphooligosaccharide--protein glycosyltransferase
MPRFHPWLISKIYLIMHAFSPDMSVMRSMFFFPVIFCAIAIIPAFFIGRRFGGNLGGLIASIIIAVHPSILGRTIAGFSDTDAYNVFIPLYVVWFLIEMLNSKSTVKTVLLGLLSGFFIGLYSIAWSGWWYLFDFIIVFVVGMCAFCLVKHFLEFKKGQVKHIFQKDFKKYLIVGVLIFVFSFLFVVGFGLLFSKTGAHDSLMFFLNRTFLEPFHFINYKEVATVSIWPNVLTTVAELNLISLSKVISYLGVVSWGSILFMAAAAGIVLLMVKKEKDMPKVDKWFIGIAVVWYALIVKLQPSIASGAVAFGVLLALPLLAAVVLILFFGSELNIEYSLFFTIFLAATMYGSTRGVRFVALAVIAYAILLGASLGRIQRYASYWISNSMKINRVLTQVMLFVLIFILVVPGQLSAAKEGAKNELPMVTDMWHDTLAKVRDNSPGKAITTSWWDWGHWFVALSNRSVTFDGGSQGIRIEPVGKTLLTPDEDDAINILRMLNCGEEESAKLLENYTGDQYRSVKLLFKIIGEDKPTARNTLLTAGLSSIQADNVLNFTHCEPIDQYYIASNDMIGKAGVWAHFGSWNFTRATMFNRVKENTYEEGMRILTGEFNLSKADADLIYSEIKAKDGDEFVTGWPSYATDSSASCQKANQTITCQNGLVLNLTSEAATIITQGGTKIPVSVSFIDKNGKFKVKEYKDSTISISAAVYTRNGAIGSIMMEPSLVASMFTRLYFFQGAGLEHFKLLSYDRDALGQDAYLYKVVWHPEAKTNSTAPAASATK